MDEGIFIPLNRDSMLSGMSEKGTPVESRAILRLDMIDQQKIFTPQSE